MTIQKDAAIGRRVFLTGSILGAGSLLASSALSLPLEEKEEGKVSTNEDLMREHGILKRVLLVYDEISRRIDANESFPASSITDSAKIIRDFIEQYHEKLEENYLFPRFRKANKLVDLTNVLLTQHQAGRRVTDRILAAKLTDDNRRRTLQSDLKAFVRMYAPHEAREDTVLFPALHEIVSPHEYDALGEEFENIERKTFGGDGFYIYVDKVAAIEKELGIYDLAQFTPQ